MSHTTGSAAEPAGKRARRTLPVLPVLLILVFLVGAGNLWAGWDEVHTFKQQLAAQQAAQQKVAAQELQALCTDVGTMAQIPPPAGDPKANPARAYAQDEHRAWQGLFTGLRCAGHGQHQARAASTAARLPGGP